MSLDNVFLHPLYVEDLATIFEVNCDWKLLKGKSILITGATGLIGTYLTDMFLLLDQKFSLNLKLLLVSRHTKETDLKNVKYLVHDITEPIKVTENIDFIIHAASNTHPLQYAKEPIETITTNIFGLYNLLELAKQNQNCRVLMLSSVEIYGDDRIGLKEGFSESDMGYLDCNTARSGYCESKRLGESLCQSFKNQWNVDCVIARLCRCYGPTLKKDDSKALSQFLRNGIEKKDIVLKSEGEQYFSYLYASDAAVAIIYLLLRGESGGAYNIADSNSDIKLKDLAKLIADNCNTKVIFDLPSEVERKGFSKAQIAILNSKKINNLGWKAKYSIQDGIKRTISILNENRG